MSTSRRSTAPLLVISPHLDDAVLSVGASLAAAVDAGRSVVICTVFAGDPQPPLSAVARAFDEDCGLGEDALAVRRDEDRAAARILGAGVVHLPFPDAVYRRHGGEWLCRHDRAMFDPQLPREPELSRRVVEQLRGLAAAGPRPEVWTCAGLGGHVDHRITRAAAETICQEEGLPLATWEDLPYAIGTAPAPGTGPECETEAGDAHLRRKLRAVACYPSQLRMLWPGQDWRAELTGHAESRRRWGRLELLWRLDLPRAPERRSVPESIEELWRMKRAE